MIIRYTYPLKGSLFLPDAWPISWGMYTVTWEIVEKLAVSVTVEVRAENPSGLPTIERVDGGSVKAHIKMGLDPHAAQVETILRTASGLLEFFAQVDVDFERPAVEWVPENEDERKRLHMYSFKSEPGPAKEALPVPYDIVARCFLAASAAAPNETPLSFIAKARREARAGRYIDAFYSYFFFFETQFAPGLSDPKRVSQRLKANADVTAAIAEARRSSRDESKGKPRLARLVNMTEGDLVDHLVATRGLLHHHALPRKDKTWHPEKHGEFEAEVTILSYAAYDVASKQNVPLLYSEPVLEAFRDGAKKVGATYVYEVEVAGGADRYGRGGLPGLNVSIPGTRPTYAAITTIEEGIRREKGPYDLKAVRAYSIKSADGAVLASYRNFTLDIDDP